MSKSLRDYFNIPSNRILAKTDDGTSESRKYFVNIEEDCNLLGIEKIPLFVAAPMVRYSKLPFRYLVRRYSTDLAFTPMIYAKNFLVSNECRNVEFSTSSEDKPLIVQFASKDPVEFATASQLVYRYANGVDLNCGCPQSNVISEGYGSKLLNNPSLVSEMVSYARHQISDPNFTVSVKIRLNSNLSKTLDFCRAIENAGVSFITIHGRTPNEHSGNVNYEAIKIIKSSVNVPVIANGGVCTYQDALNVVKHTNVDGVMSANGLLRNPALFAGYQYAPIQCVKDWLEITALYGCSFENFHHILIFMLRRLFSSSERTIFNELTSRAAVVDFLSDYLDDS